MLEETATEIADVQIYLLRLADVLGVDVPESVRKNRDQRIPILTFLN